MNEKLQVYDTKMQKTLHSLDAELATIRAGRANPHILDKLTVDYYGSATPIQQVANISAPEARMIQIQPWEKSMVKEIEKAILTSDIGINPTNDGTVIRLVFPELTEERRKENRQQTQTYGSGQRNGQENRYAPPRRTKGNIMKNNTFNQVINANLASIDPGFGQFALAKASSDLFKKVLNK